MNDPSSTPRAFFALLGAVLALAVFFSAPRQFGTSPPGASPPGAVPAPSTAGGLSRSSRLELEAIAPLGTAQVQLGWVLPEAGAPGWGEIEVGALPTLTPALIEEGRTLNQRLCAACHGATGRGDGELAASLASPPRDLRGLLRTRDSTGRPRATEVFRSLSAGAPAYGMPAFAHLPAEERWALTAWVLSLQRDQDPTLVLSLGARPPEADVERRLHLGQDVFNAQCATCHGRYGRGEGTLTASLASAGFPPTDFRRGASAFRGGARAEDVARAIRLGRPGTPMVPLSASSLSDDELWAVSAYVERLAQVGESQRRAAWNAFFADDKPLENVQGALPAEPMSRWNERLSRRWRKAPRGRETGCLACHKGLTEISDGAMKTALDAFGAGDPSGACVVCHEGRGDRREKSEAHRGLIPNPGSLWVTSVGAGCAKCHSAPGSLTTLQARALPEAVGGRLMHARSRRTDPSGATSGNYTYRVQRSLMAQETGKVLLLTSSVDLVDPSQPGYSDFPLQDPDGPVPCVGGPPYREVIARGLKSGYLMQLSNTKGLPTFGQALELCGSGEDAYPRAALVDYGRKNCFRCHVWGEGKATRLEHRSAGCSACHVVWGDEGLYEGEDRTVPKRRSGHPIKHRITMTPPDEQCNHCHTRNPYTAHSEPHQIAGMACVDCHTSIDMHGDGNIYPHMEHQVEVRCEDCHGSAQGKPWELRLGEGTPLVGTKPRGVYTAGEKRHLLTNRGNPRTNWLRVGDKVVIESLRTGKSHTAPRLNAPREPKTGECGAGVAGHEEVSCSLCHNREAPRCGSCHMRYERRRADQDWLLSAAATNPLTSRQRDVFTPGFTDFDAERKGSVPFGAPDTRRDRANRWSPREPGCKVSIQYIDGGRPKGGLYIPRFNPGSPSYPPVVANTHPHESAIPPRTCAECHPQGAGKGKSATLFGDVQPDRGDWWRPDPPKAASQRARRRWRR
jgi:cytochrome c